MTGFDWVVIEKSIDLEHAGKMDQRSESKAMYTRMGLFFDEWQRTNLHPWFLGYVAVVVMLGYATRP